jgi:hypothetical protein
VVLSWQYGEDGYLESGDALRVQLSSDGGNTWSSFINVFNDDLGSSFPNNTFSYTIPASYLTSGFRMRIYLDGFADSGEYCYVDNITVSCPILNEDCSSFDDAPATWTDGSLWYASSGEFVGRGGGGTSDRTLTLSNNLNLSGYAAGSVIVSWEQSANSQVDYSDTFYYALYNGSWGSNQYVFNDDSPSPSYSFTLPSNYLVSNFRIRFYDNFNSSNEYVYLDNIKISVGIFTDSCSDFNNWTLTNSAWSIYGNYCFVGHYAGTDNSARYLPLSSSMNLNAYADRKVFISWDQWCAAAWNRRTPCMFPSPTTVVSTGAMAMWALTAIWRRLMMTLLRWPAPLAAHPRGSASRYPASISPQTSRCAFMWRASATPENIAI